MEGIASCQIPLHREGPQASMPNDQSLEYDDVEDDGWRLRCGPMLLSPTMTVAPGLDLDGHAAAWSAHLRSVANACLANGAAARSTLSEIQSTRGEESAVAFVVAQPHMRIWLSLRQDHWRGVTPATMPGVWAT